MLFKKSSKELGRVVCYNGSKDLGKYVCMKEGRN